MNQQPDKLFRDKVADLKVNVPANAWSRVEANLDKKNKDTFWLKVAASLLVVALGVFYFVPKSQTSGMKFASKKETPKTSMPKQNNDNSMAPSNALDKKQNEPINRVSEKRVQRSAKKLKKRELAPEKKLIEQPTSEQSIASAVETPSVESLERVTLLEEKVSSAVVAEAQNKSSHISIVITSTEANEKYLDKKSLADATSEEKKSSTLRKLLDTAYDLKNNQDPFGDLRQKKNEILALNFKSEKQRSQNK
jgi:hypothetical protein